MFKTLSIFNTIYTDAPQPWQIGFQDSAAPGFTGIVELHNTIFFYLIVICVGVFWVLGSSIYYFNIKNSPIIHKYLNHGKYVPIQKCSKSNNNFLKNGVYISKHSFSTLPKNTLKNDNINYVKFYENALDMKKDILNENKGKSGIYMWTNKITKEIYIGKSINLSNRFSEYFSDSYIKSKDNLTINKALKKYGYSNFSVSILEYCDKSDLLTREKFYIHKLNPQYNKSNTKIAGSSLKSEHSEISKARIRKKAVSVKKKSENYKELTKQKALARKHSEDTKLKMSAISGNPVYIYEKLSSKGFKLIGSFVSARRAGKLLGISGTTVIKYRNSGEIFKDRYKFSSK